MLPGSSSLIIEPDAVHVWLCETSAVADGALCTAYERLLADDERTRRARLSRPGDRHLMLVSRVLVRSLAARYLGCAPESVAYRQTKLGRPELDVPHVDHRLRFSLSHTEGLIAVAFTSERAVGADVERMRDDPWHDRIAKQHFAALEYEQLDALPAAARGARFIDLWVLKEAYAKARGLGLSLALDSYAVSIDDTGALLRLSARDDPAVNTWHLWLLAPTPSHRLAVAIQDASRTPRLHVYRCVPLLREEEHTACTVLARTAAL